MAIYISLTSIFRNQNELFLTLQSIVKQSKQPDKIFLYLSDEPSFFDAGFLDKEITEKNLTTLLSKHKNLIHVAWGKDIGPYGKLLPLLKEKWDEDCLIITIDDDTEYHPDLIKNLVEDYMIHKCVISYRGFVPNIKHISELSYDNRIMNIGLQHVSKEQHKHLYNFPTGKGGVLYHPSFFHKTEQLIFENKIYLETCSTADDIWFMLIRVLNNVPCFLMARPWCEKDNSTSGLFVNFNHNHNKNNVFIRNTIERLKLIHDFSEKEVHEITYENKKVIFHGIRNDHIGKTWGRNLFYEDRLLEKIRHMELHGTYVDVGAHHGNHSLFFSKFCIPEKVIAIEGNPFNFEYLKENVATNQCSNVHCISVLASNTEGETCEMSYTLKNTGASTMKTATDGTPSELRHVSNKTNTLDNLLATTENICLVKIDVQQHEYETLQGCVAVLEKHAPVIAISIHANQNETLIKKFLSDLKYTTDNNNYGVSGTFIYTRDRTK